MIEKIFEALAQNGQPIIFGGPIDSLQGCAVIETKVTNLKEEGKRITNLGKEVLEKERVLPLINGYSLTKDEQGEIYLKNGEITNLLAPEVFEFLLKTFSDSAVFRKALKENQKQITELMNIFGVKQ